MATRLNKDMREMIARAIVRHGHKERATAARDAVAHLANVVLDHLLGDNLGLYHAVPPAWFENGTGINVNVGGGRHFINFSGLSFGSRLRRYVDKPLDTYRRIPHDIKDGVHIIHVNTPLGQHIERVMIEYSTVGTTIERAEGAATRTLEKFATVERAIKEWPEAKKFLTPYLQSPTVKLPAVITPEINKLLDLPPEGDDDETDVQQ